MNFAMLFISICDDKSPMIKIILTRIADTIRIIMNNSLKRKVTRAISCRIPVIACPCSDVSNTGLIELSAIAILISDE